MSSNGARRPGRQDPEAMLHAAFTQEYGIDYPIVQAALGIASMPPLVAAVSNAGGMGTLGAVGAPLMSPAELEDLITAIRSLTNRPFGVNFITPLATEDHVRVCAQHAVPVVSFHLGIPPDPWMNLLCESGNAIWIQVSSTRMARDAVHAGADAVIAQGREAGGSNRSVTGTMTLVPAVLDAVDPVPVLAAGGIADGRGLAAALALGAAAVWMGTRFLASREANAHAEYKRRILAAADTDTAITTIFQSEGNLQRPVRVLRNAIVDEWSGREADAGTVAPRVIGRTELGGRKLDMLEFSTILPTPETNGDFDQMCLLAGESAALIHDLKPAADIIRDIMQECTRAIRAGFGPSAANAQAPFTETGSLFLHRDYR